MIWDIVLLVVIAVVAVAVLLTPRVVDYIETVDIAARVALVYDLIRFQERLMRWSAWPSETGSTCALKGIDGQVDAGTVFFDKKGARFGQQEVVALEPDRSVTMAIQSKGPPQHPVVRYELEPLPADRTRIVLRFTNDLSRPFNVVLRMGGIVRWTRAMHRKDLDGLKRYAEPPRRTYVGAPAAEPVDG